MEPPPTVLGQPDQVLVLINGMRADIGDDALASRAIGSTLARRPFATFDQAYAQSASPLLSLASILTGRYVAAIPMCTRPDNVEAGSTSWCDHVPDDVPTVPEVLALYGYDTLLATDAYDIGSVLGDEFGANYSPQEPPAKASPATAWAPSERERVLEWWKSHEDSPRLAVLVWNITEGAVFWRPEQQLDTSSIQRDYARLVEETTQDVLQVLQRMLPASPVRPWSLIVTSGRGLSLGEKGGAPDEQTFRVTGGLLLDRILHVPLYVFTPENVEAPATGEGVVQLLDIMPTMLARAGATLPAGIPGSDLANQLSATHDSGFAYAEWGDMLALRSGHYYYLARSFRHGGSSLDPNLTQALLKNTHRWAMWDVQTDPWQLHDLSEARRPDSDIMRKAMIRIRTGPAAPRVEAPEWDLEALQEVRTQGYW